MTLSTKTSRLTVRLAQHLIASGRITKQELVCYCHAMAVAGETIWGLNAFSHLYSKDDLLEQLEEQQEQQQQQQQQNHLQDKKPLAGIPVSVKANFAVQQSPLTASSQILVSNETTCCGYDAHVVRLLKSSGAIIIGITQMDEFGMGSLGTHLGQGNTTPTKNPLSLAGIYNNNQQRTYSQWQEQIQKSQNDILEEQQHMAAIQRNNHFNETDETCHGWYTGGSSCGSAASVAHGSSLISLASDTGGSIRLPAAWCGITGFKPLYSRLSRKGLVSYASSLDTVGFLAPSADCISIVLHQMECSNNNINNINNENTISDSTLVPHKQTNPKTLADNLKGIQVGIPAAFSVHGCPKEIMDAWAGAASQMQNNGATLSEIPSTVISPDMIQASLAAYYIIASAEASSNLARYDGLRYGMTQQTCSQHYPPSTLENSNGHHYHPQEQEQQQQDWSMLENTFAKTRSVGFGNEVLRRVLSGTFVLSSEQFHTHYQAASKIRALITQQLRQALDMVDVLLLPTCLSMPNTTMDRDPTGMFANDVLTVPISLACLSAISIPWCCHDGTVLPIGIQIVGNSDEQVLEVAKTLQQLVSS